MNRTEHLAMMAWYWLEIGEHIRAVQADGGLPPDVREALVACEAATVKAANLVQLAVAQEDRNRPN